MLDHRDDFCAGGIDEDRERHHIPEMGQKTRNTMPCAPLVGVRCRVNGKSLGGGKCMSLSSCHYSPSMAE